MKDYLVINESAYDQTATEYKDRFAEYQEGDTLLITPFIDYLSRKFTVNTVLELGPGSGLALKILEAAGHSTVALDISANIIDVARTNSPQTEFIKSDFLAHDFGDNHYTGIFAKAFIHLFPKDDAIEILNKAHALLVSNGAFFLATTVHEESREGYEEKADYNTSPIRYRKKWTEAELLKALGNKWDIISKSYNTERGKSWLALTLAKRT